MTLYIDNKPYIPDDARENMIQQIREAGESLIKNAKSLVGTEKYISDIRISFSVDPHPMGLPYIDVTKTYYPEKPFERK